MSPPPLTDTQLALLIEHFGANVVVGEAIGDEYSRDWSPAVPQRPGAVVFVESSAMLTELVRFSAIEGVPLTPRGGGTGKSGGCVPQAGGLVVALERMNRVLEFDVTSRTVTVEPGLNTGALQALVAGHGLVFPPDPGSYVASTVGGNVATNASGMHTVRDGVTRDWVLGVRAHLADASSPFFGKRTHKGVTGLDIAGLFVGSEGTLGLVSEIVLKLRPQEPAGPLTIAFFRSVKAACEAVTALGAAGLKLAACELLDGPSLAAVRKADVLVAGEPAPRKAEAALIVEAPGDDSRWPERAHEALDRAGAFDLRVANGEADVAAVWGFRRELSKRVKEGYRHYLNEDVCVPLRHLPELVGFIGSLRGRADYAGLGFASYGHAGDGNLHVNVLYNDRGSEREDGQGLTDAVRAKAALEDILRFVLAHEGTLSAEHGIGTVKLAYVPWELTDEVRALQRRVKAVFDPHNLMNPGKKLG
jgi:glycolate oxidase